MLLTDDEGMRSAALWGLYFIPVAFLFSFQRFINAIFADSFAIKFISLEGFLLALFVIAILHIRGYVYLGSKYDSKSVKYAAMLQIFATGFLGFCLLTQIFVRAFYISPGTIYDGLIGLSITILLIAQAFFIYGLIKLRARTGAVGLTAALFPAWTLFFWYGWPTILLIAPSIYVLLKNSDPTR